MSPSPHLPTDAFVGRRDELEAIDAAFSGRCRLVTITGHGGIGKTRLAREYAALRSDPELDDIPIHFVELAEVRTLDELIGEIALAFEVQVDDSGDAIERVGLALGNRGALLIVLDNVEQVVKEAAELVRIWRLAAPQALFLITSRIALGLGGEQRIEMPPLPAEESRELFETRARAADHRFAILPPDGEPLSQLIQRLDGIPLAIELAAARTTSMSVPTLSRRLTESFDILRSGRRDRSSRHLTLANTIEWSWNLLAVVEREVLARLSVFHGGFTTPAADAVIGSDTSDALTTLLDQSLLMRDRSPSGEIRFRLSEPIREQVRAHLDEQQLEAANDRYADYFAEIARSVAAPGAAYGTCGCEVTERALLEGDNLRAALEYSAERAPRIAAEIGLALAHLNHLRGSPPQRIGRALDTALEAAEACGDLEILCRLRIARAGGRLGWRDALDTEPELHETLQLARRVGSAELEGLALYDLASLYHDQGDKQVAREILEEAVEILEQAGESFALGLCLEGLSLATTSSGEMRLAFDYRERALATHRRAGNLRSEAISLRNRADMYAEDERSVEALADTKKAFSTLMRIGTRHHGITMINLAQFSAQAGQLEEGRALASEMVDAIAQGRVPQLSCDPYFVLGWIELAAGNIAAAESVLSEGLGMGGLGDTTVRANSRICRGAARLLDGRLDAARDDLLAAIESCRAHASSVNDAAIAASFLAAVEFVAGNLSQVWPWIAYARLETERWSSYPRYRRVLVIVEALCEARPVPEVEAGRHPFLEELVARRAVAAIREGAPTAATKVLRLGPHAAWLELPDGERIALSAKPVLQKIVSALVRGHLRDEGVLSVQLMEAVWPDDRSERRSIENRLWVAMSSLRRLGLGDIVRKGPDGYRLDRDLQIVQD